MHKFENCNLRYNFRIKKLSRAVTPFGSRSGSVASAFDNATDNEDDDSKVSAAVFVAPTVTPSKYRIHISPANTPKISVTEAEDSRANKKVSSDFAELLSRGLQSVPSMEAAQGAASTPPTAPREKLILYRRQRRPGITFQNMTIKRPRRAKEKDSSNA